MGLLSDVQRFLRPLLQSDNAADKLVPEGIEAAYLCCRLKRDHSQSADGRPALLYGPDRLCYHRRTAHKAEFVRIRRCGYP
ncbi:hypothetical protein KCP70_04060 [Salmonella enterica subsp. enterica]|nr:hypothetical protein KCP70_04060 [Salmonella enterica subsp. enterica]